MAAKKAEMQATVVDELYKKLCKLAEAGMKCLIPNRFLL